MPFRGNDHKSIICNLFGIYLGLYMIILYIVFITMSIFCLVGIVQ